MPLRKFVITQKPLKKVTAHRCHCFKLLCLTSHSILVLFVFRRLVWDRPVKLSMLPLDAQKHSLSFLRPQKHFSPSDCYCRCLLPPFRLPSLSPLSAPDPVSSGAPLPSLSISVRVRRLLQAEPRADGALLCSGRGSAVPGALARLRRSARHRPPRRRPCLLLPPGTHRAGTPPHLPALPLLPLEL